MAGIVTHDAKSGFSSLLSDCLKESFKVADTEVKMKKVPSLTDIDEKEFIMLTVSSYTFRIFTILHFTRNDATMDYVSTALKMSRENLEESKYYDYLGEVGNTFCGAFKRELGRYFPHLGMSTPNRLAKGSLSYMHDMDFEYDDHYETRIDGKASFYASMFISAYSELDFRIPVNSRFDEDVNTGALEMF